MPDRFVATLVVALAFMALLTVDQMHWWQLKPDYAFGWLVPLFVVYVVADRWPMLREIFQATGSSPLSPLWRGALSLLIGLGFVGGLVSFLIGALYRGGLGATQPGSLALAMGFSGVLLGLIYFNTADGRVGTTSAAGWRALRTDARLRATALFLFPALIWIVSAPLVTAVENAVSLLLLRKVVAVVFAVFNFMGFPIIQEGNVLVLPRGQVGVVDACSGIRSLTGCLFAGAFLAAVLLDRFWKKILLVGAAAGFAFLANLARSLFLTSWAYAYGSEAIEGPLHDLTGYAVLGLTVIGLFALVPLFRGENWRRWLGLKSAAARSGVRQQRETGKLPDQVDRNTPAIAAAKTAE